MIKIECDYSDMVPAKELVEHPKNPNKHSSKQVKRLAKLIKEHGFRVPIIVSENTGFIVAGHGRLQAAGQLKMKEVPVSYQSFKHDAMEYQFLVADNAINQWAELDMSAINADFAEFGPFDTDLLGLEDFVVDPSEVDFPDLADSEPEFQQVTFIVSNVQKKKLDSAIEKAKDEFDFSKNKNKNQNGNAVAKIAELFISGR